MTHVFITLALPLAIGAARKVRPQLERLGNPIGETLSGDAAPEGLALKAALDATRAIHFMSGAIAPGAPGEKDHLILEISADGTEDEILAHFAADAPIGMALAPTLAAANITGGDRVETLRGHSLKTGSGLRDLPGLNFTGTPGLSVERIHEEAALATTLRDHIAEEVSERPTLGARARLDDLRTAVRTRERFAQVRDLIDTALPVPMLVEQKIQGLSVSLALRLAYGASKHLLWPVILVALLIAIVRSLPIYHSLDATLPLWSMAWGAFIWAIVWRTIVWTTLLSVLVWLFVLRSLSRREKAEHPDDTPPNPSRLEEVRRREDRNGLQNHLFGVSRMKPGILRALLLRFAFWLITFAAAQVYRPGHLKDIGTIHFARWARIPGTNTLLFLSNYGGSWESYLEDFITKAPNGLTAVWSNTFGFPQARLLFGKGARNAAPFKRWARRQQHPTLLWYSAYPHLSTARIRVNAAIRNGLVSAMTEDEARATLALLGSRPAPAEALEKDEIQTLVLSGLSKHKQSVVTALRLPDDLHDARDWLKAARTHVGHGEGPMGPRIDQIALSARGLARLGQADLVADFPYVFKAGMEARAAALGDTGEDAPQHWTWGAGDNTADALIISYLRDPAPYAGDPDSPPKPDEADAAMARLAAFAAEVRTQIAHDIVQDENGLERKGGRVIEQITTLHLDDKSRRPDGTSHAREFFGFADGVSQPRIRGLRPYRLVEVDQHIQAPGEFILGYPDNRAQRSTAGRVPAHNDPNHLLPVANADHGRANQPDLAESGINEMRDFTRNGSFLVVRQLAQDVDAFNRTLRAAAKRFARHPGLPSALHGDPAVLDDLEGAGEHERTIAERRMHYIGAKMVGRWRDGSSLISYPNAPASGWEDALDPRPASPLPEPDNGFLFGRDDPAGHACPYGSHIRRTNPRDSLNPRAKQQVGITNRHRILRRGRFFITHNPAATARNAARDEGLMFICANADIERQFEFIQQTWIMAPQFHGLHDEVDPLFSRKPEHLERPADACPMAQDRFTIPTPKGPMVMTGINDSIRTVGGGYFFLPSRAALCFLIEGAADPSIEEA